MRRLIDAEETKEAVKKDGMLNQYWQDYFEQGVIDRVPTVAYKVTG